LLFGALALRFFQPLDVERKHCSLTNARRKARRPDGYVDVSLLQQFHVFNFFVKTFYPKCGGRSSCTGFSVVYTQHGWAGNMGFLPGTDVAREIAKHEQTLAYGPRHLIKQTTLGSVVETHGIGLHTAVPVHVRLVPAPPDTGYVFRRTDLGGFEIPATVESVAHCGYATTLMRTGVMLSTVEHLLAALRGLGVDNAFIEVDNLEIPIMDGSAEDFAQIIERAGIVEQPLARRALLVREKVSYEQGNRRISVEPADTYQIDCLIDFSHPMIGVQSLFVELNNGAFSRDIAAARTFGFTNEIEELRKANLIRGGSLDNAIVLTPEGMLNETGLRFRDEFVRHKILDIIGDLALLGMPILGKVVAERSGHIMHAGLMSKLLRVRSAWDIVDM
jgi:UDP-3-O-[3-hydroxymyristoyl] N-acetylglucosamine deacetylase